MKIRFYSKDNNMEEMKKFFQKRTDKHVSLVRKFCEKIQDYDPEKFDGLVERGQKHDQSKYENPELDPYIYITWQYKCKGEGKSFDPPDGMEEKMDKASGHHVNSNRHHPEFHDSKKSDKDLIDATSMNDIDIGEMVADWFAMSEELSNSPKKWADKNINVKWKFNKKQVDLIYELIDNVWKD